MSEKNGSNLQKFLAWVGFKPRPEEGKEEMKIIRKGMAMRVIFFYPGEEGTYVDHASVTLYENGIVNIASNQEETTTHLQNCEILWRFETDADDRANKVRLLKPKTDTRSAEELAGKPDVKIDAKSDGKPAKGSPVKNLE
jgi:hypothetical protein